MTERRSLLEKRSEDDAEGMSLYIALSFIPCSSKNVLQVDVSKLIMKENIVKIEEYR